LGHNADPAVRSAWLRDRFLTELVDWSLNQVVVRSGGRPAQRHTYSRQFDGFPHQ
jgi:hypothetical protein